MSARADALRFQGTSRKQHSPWVVVLLALLVAVGVAVTLSIVNSTGSSTTVDKVGPAAGANAGRVAAPATNVLQVGGTSAYRYHPLPGVNTVFELVSPAGSRTDGGALGGAVTVGGGSAYQHHPLP